MEVKLAEGYCKKNNKYYKVNDFKNNSDYRNKIDGYLVCPECKIPEITLRTTNKTTKSFILLEDQKHSNCSFITKNQYTQGEIKKRIKQEKFIRGEAEKVFNILKRENSEIACEENIETKKVNIQKIKYETNMDRKIRTEKRMPRRKFEYLQITEDGYYFVVWTKIKANEVNLSHQNSMFKNYKIQIKNNISIGISKEIMKHFTEEQKNFFEEDSNKVYLICFSTKVVYNDKYKIFNLNINHSKEFFIDLID